MILQPVLILICLLTSNDRTQVWLALLGLEWHCRLVRAIGLLLAQVVHGLRIEQLIRPDSERRLTETGPAVLAEEPLGRLVDVLVGRDVRDGQAVKGSEVVVARGAGHGRVGRALVVLGRELLLLERVRLQGGRVDRGDGRVAVEGEALVGGGGRRGRRGAQPLVHVHRVGDADVQRRHAVAGLVEALLQLGRQVLLLRRRLVDLHVVEISEVLVCCPVTHRHGLRQLLLGDERLCRTRRAVWDRLLRGGLLLEHVLLSGGCWCAEGWCSVDDGHGSLVGLRMRLVLHGRAIGNAVHLLVVLQQVVQRVEVQAAADEIPHEVGLHPGYVRGGVE